MSSPTRQFAAKIVAVVASVLVLPAVLAGWLAGVATDTDRYVDTVAPLATSQQVLDAVSARLVELSVQAVEQRVGGLAQGGATRAAIEKSVTRASDKVLGTEEFAAVWATANRQVHLTAMELLSSDERLDDSGVLTLDLTGTVQKVVDRVAASLNLPSITVPDHQLAVQVVDADTLDRARTSYRLLDAAGYWLPIIVIALVAAALVLAANRLEMVGFLAEGVAMSLAVLAVGLHFGKRWAVSQINEVDRGLVGAVADEVTRDLVTAVWVALVAAALTSLGVSMINRHRRAQSR